MGWLDITIVTLHNLFVHFKCWNGEERNNKIRKGWRLIQHNSLWAIWKSINVIIFNCSTRRLMRWWGRLNIPSYYFYEWCWNPKVCLLCQLLHLRGEVGVFSIGVSFSLDFLFHGVLLFCQVEVATYLRCLCNFVFRQFARHVRV